MKIAIVGDPHISTGFRARKDDYLHTVLGKLDYIASKNDYVIMLGDVFDTSSMPTVVFNETYKMMSKHSGKFYTILGNHDLFHRNLRAINKTTIGSLQLTKVLNIKVKPFELAGITFVPVMTDDDIESIPEDNDNDAILLGHKYFEMNTCPEESIYKDIIRLLNYKYIFLGHDHQNYELEVIGNTLMYRGGSLTRTTVDEYNKDRKVGYYELDSETGAVKWVDIPMLPISEAFLDGSFDKKEVKGTTKTDKSSLAKLLAKFDTKSRSNLSIEDVLRRLNATEEQITYIRTIHRENNISYC